MRCPLCTILGVSALLAIPAFLIAATPMQKAPAPAAVPAAAAGEKEWKVHDRDRPQPAMVTAGNHGGAPSDATALFDGKDMSQWTGGDNQVKWAVKDGIVQITPGSGDIRTKESFGSCQLHIEWMVPETCQCKDQHGCNSGVFFMDQYELQILGSNPNKTYVDGMAGAMYGQYPPLVNPCRPNGQWNTYDVVFHAPIFAKDGTVTKVGTMTVLFNGILVQDHSEIWGSTAHGAKAHYTAHADKLPIHIQDHGDALCFRNIWIRPLAN